VWPQATLLRSHRKAVSRSARKFIECVAAGHTAKKAMRSIAAGQNVAEKNRTKAVARLRFFGARAAVGGEAHTGLLGEV
jgi:hypothetical protein